VTKKSKTKAAPKGKGKERDKARAAKGGKVAKVAKGGKAKAAPKGAQSEAQQDAQPEAQNDAQETQEAKAAPKVARVRRPKRRLTPAQERAKAKRAKAREEDAEAEAMEAAEKKKKPKKVKPGSALVVVESPAKARTIGKYLGAGYTVKASVGHVRDLPKSKIGVDFDNGFEPSYEIIEGKKKVLAEIRKAARESETVYLASDPDREGEAIAWHIAEEIKEENQNLRRILINEITK
jgi:DNA topoisomerase-1